MRKYEIYIFRGLKSVILCLILCYKRNGSWFGVLHQAMDALGKLGEHSKI